MSLEEKRQILSRFEGICLFGFGHKEFEIFVAQLEEKSRTKIPVPKGTGKSL
ncbi:hypothetical protein [Lactobacillus delbrueckii]|uniref:hypothetical protein n=1 Tax=Lactobacillus delbrueckii TaxID=1584 RepID=UPI0019D05D88|nr:hypothetical protein [Lactobacillus delbrueckii]MBN6090908.1 hypothetical protein [Lactobacillus delbrueckii subsp. bulgaricus]